MSLKVWGLICSLCMWLGVIHAQTFEQARDSAQEAKRLLDEGAWKSAEEMVVNILPQVEEMRGDTLPAFLHRLLRESYYLRGKAAKQTIVYAKKARELYRQSTPIEDPRAIQELYWIGESFVQLKDVDSLEFYWQLALEEYEVYSPTSYAMKGLVANNLASNYLAYGYTQLGIHYRYKAVEAWEQDPEEVGNLATGYSNLGNSIETAMAPLYLRKALNLSRDISSPTAYIPLADLGSKYRSLAKYDQAMQYYRQAAKEAKAQFEATKDINQYGYDLAIIYSLMGQVCGKQKQYNTGIAYVEKAEKIIQETDWEGTKIYLQIRKALIIHGQNGGGYDLAEDALLRARAITSPMFGFAAVALVNFYAKDKDYEYALKYSYLATHYYAEKAFPELPQSKDAELEAAFLEKLTPSLAVAERLYQHADFLLHLPPSQGFHSEEKAEQLLRLSLQFFEELRSVDISLGYKQNLQHTISCLQSLYLHKGQDEQAFEMAEKSRVTRTQLAFGNYQVQKEMGLPVDRLAEKWTNRGKIARLEERLFELKKAQGTDVSPGIDSLYDQIFALSQKNAALDAEWAKAYPLDLVQGENQTATIEEIQQALPEKTLMLSFQFQEEGWIRFEVGKEQFQVKKFENSQVLERLVDSLRSLTLDFTAYDVGKWRSLSHRLYQLLMPSSLKMYDHLVILPDQSLHFLPFEMLCTSDMGSQFAHLDYLTRTHRISYGASATLWLLQQQVQQEKKQASWAGFAPSYENQFIAQVDTQQNQALSILVREGNLALPAAQQEVESLMRIMEGEVFVGKEATESRFKEIAADYQVLHLAMHTLLEDEEPLFSKLLFQSVDSIDNGNLTIAELFALSLQADLAVLSACNTGYGSLMPGEGVTSLSQAFTAAGCPSTVMSLWQVPDQETADLMVAFYQNLKEGQPKDQALQRAKLRYLSQISNDRLAHPYFWAGFVASGNMQALALASSLPWNIVGGILLGVMLILFAIYLMRQRA
ncbi:MAG: CHAT domain-containing protein [Bacteroidota bacterium]